MNVLTIEQVRLLGHHCFTIAKLEEAKQTLLKLWEWKKLTRSTTNERIIKNLDPRSKANKSCNKLARDIIDFLHVEDAKLNVIFLI